MMNGTNQAALNIIIMKWLHLVSQGFVHQGNDEEVMSLSLSLSLPTSWDSNRTVLEPGGYTKRLETDLCHLLAQLE